MQKSIVFFWSGLTAYGARALEVLRQVHENTTIVALKSSFPYRGVQDLFKGRIIWVEEADDNVLFKMPKDVYNCYIDYLV